MSCRQRRRFRQVLELGAVAGVGGLRPRGDPLQIVASRRSAAGLLQPVQAQIVRPALHVGGGERHAERLLQHRQVLEVDLLLQVLGAGGHQHALAAEDGGDEIGERLAGASAGFGKQHSARSSVSATAPAMAR